MVLYPPPEDMGTDENGFPLSYPPGYAETCEGCGSPDAQRIVRAPDSPRGMKLLCDACAGETWQ
jgi:hypothetical protein